MALLPDLVFDYFVLWWCLVLSRLSAEHIAGSSAFRHQRLLAVLAPSIGGSRFSSSKHHLPRRFDTAPRRSDSIRTLLHHPQPYSPPSADPAPLTPRPSASPETSGTRYGSGAGQAAACRRPRLTVLSCLMVASMLSALASSNCRSMFGPPLGVSMD